MNVKTCSGLRARSFGPSKFVWAALGSSENIRPAFDRKLKDGAQSPEKKGKPF
jgi:hypothetical protein